MIDIFFALNLWSIIRFTEFNSTVMFILIMNFKHSSFRWCNIFLVINIIMSMIICNLTPKGVNSLLIDIIYCSFKLRWFLINSSLSPKLISLGMPFSLLLGKYEFLFIFIFYLRESVSIVKAKVSWILVRVRTNMS